MTTPRRCPRGHLVPIELEDCPVCGAPLEKTAPSGRSLWDMMQQVQPAEPDRESVKSPVAAGSDEHRDDPDDPNVAGDEGESRPRGLWGVMQQASPPVAPLDDPVELDDLDQAHAQSPPGPEIDEDSGDGGDDPSAELEWPNKDSEDDPAVEPISRSSRCRTSLVLGVLAILLAGVGLLPPEFWTRLPALIVGLAAVYTGLVGLGELRAASKPVNGRGEAMSGIGFGTLGMFLTRILDALL